MGGGGGWIFKVIREWVPGRKRASELGVRDLKCITCESKLREPVSQLGPRYAHRHHRHVLMGEPYVPFVSNKENDSFWQVGTSFPNP